MTQASVIQNENPLLFQHNLTRSASITGIGVHSGKDVTVTIHPSSSPTGIIFIRTDAHDTEIPARWDTVVNTQNCTTIGNQEGVTVSTIEHLMATFAARGVDHARVEITGPEMPIMDGSAVPFLELVDQANPEATSISRRLVRVLKSVTFEGDDGRTATLSPANTPSFHVEFSFHGRVSFPDQSLDFLPLNQSFDQLIAPARTFGLLEDAERIKAMGLAKGASLENTIVFDKNSVVNPEGTRFDDECVRHKVLDIIGDFHIAGGIILGAYHGVQTGHTLNNQLLRKLFSDPSTFEIQEPPLP